LSGGNGEPDDGAVHGERQAPIEHRRRSHHHARADEIERARKA
jgi:hypothetical protein